MKIRKLFALVVALALVAALALPVFAAPGDLVADLTADEMDYFAGGGDGTDFFMNAGSSTKSIQDGGLKLADRTANWNALDISMQNFAEAGKEYTAVVTFKNGGSPQSFVLGETDAPYGILAGPVDAGANETVTLTVKVDGGNFNASMRGIRMQTGDGETGDYIIMSARVYEGDPPAGGGGGGAAPAGGGDNPATGENTTILFAGMALVLAAGGVVLLRKRAKSN